MVAVASACGTVTANATSGVLDGDAGADARLLEDGALFGDVPRLPDGSPGFCTETNALVPLPDGRCTGDVGKKTFLFAACACTTMQVAGTLTTDALDSTVGGTPGDGASIGADTSVRALSTIFLQGSVWAGGTDIVFGTPAVAFDHSGIVTREVHAGGDLSTKQPFTVQGDLFVSGDIFAAPTLTCEGSAHVSPGGKTTNVDAKKGILSTTDLVVADPCDCTKKLDVGSIVHAFAASNDDAAAGLTAASLAAAPATKVTLPCGRYYFDSIGGDAITLDLPGRTAIFVAGDVTAKKSLTISLAPGAELDLFIGGNLTLDGDATLGRTDAPAHARVYVGGKSMTMSGGVKIGANVYAPNADMAVASDFEMSGAILVHSLAASGNFTVHYDVSILNVRGCQSAAKTCTTCHDCAGATPACKGGTCAACAENKDCCAPLVCRSGQCVADVK
jgi:hypothetical protein